MKFKNITIKPINMRIDGVWRVVEPEEYIEMEGYIGVRQLGLSSDNLEISKPVVEKPVEIEEEYIEFLTKDELWKMTKDELNDYGAKIDLDKINTSMKKADMINTILDYIEEYDE